MWAADPNKKYYEAAKTKFLDVDSADAWLIAYAMHDTSCIIITNEVAAPESKRSIKLPDAAAAMGVPIASLVDVLSKHAGPNFVFKP